MPDKPKPMDEWRTEWRRNGAGVMAATFLVGGGWVSASQTFVASKDGQLVHPSPFGWLLVVCSVGFALGFYAWLSTYIEQLPMLGRKKAKRMEAWESRRGNMDFFRESSRSMRPVQVELVEHDQFRQAVAKLREAGITEFRSYDLTCTLRVMERTGKDPAYEPLWAARDGKGIVALVESGELLQSGADQFSLPDEAQP